MPHWMADGQEFLGPLVYMALGYILGAAVVTYPLVHFKLLLFGRLSGINRITSLLLILVHLVIAVVAVILIPGIVLHQYAGARTVFNGVLLLIILSATIYFSLVPLAKSGYFKEWERGDIRPNKK